MGSPRWTRLASAVAMLGLFAVPAPVAAEPARGCGIDLVAPLDEPTPVANVPCGGVRPGAIVRTSTGRCTFNFVFTGSDGHTYIGTAGHCVLKFDEERVWGPDEGPPAWDVDERRIGEFVYAVQLSSPERDFAVIRVDDGIEVDPAMCHFGAPTSMYTDLDPEPVVMRHFGYGIGLGETVPGRTAVALHTLDPDYVTTFGAADWGDSGSGIMTADGEAVGVIVHLRPLPVGGTTGITRLAPQLERAESTMDIELELTTS